MSAIYASRPRMFATLPTSVSPCAAFSASWLLGLSLKGSTPMLFFGRPSAVGQKRGKELLLTQFRTGTWQEISGIHIFGPTMAIDSWLRGKTVRRYSVSTNRRGKTSSCDNCGRGVGADEKYSEFIVEAESGPDNQEWDIKFIACDDCAKEVNTLLDNARVLVH
jgi:hypothetical protein